MCHALQPACVPRGSGWGGGDGDAEPVAAHHYALPSTAAMTAEFLQCMYSDCKNSADKMSVQDVTLFNPAGEKFAVIRLAVVLLEETI